MTIHNETFPPLDIVFQSDGLINLIDPTEDGSGNQWAVLVHPAQVRHLAERLGLIASTTADKSVSELQRENDRHRRNLLRVRERGMHLQSDFAKHADWDHADLLHEMTLINGVVDLLDLACDGFTDSLANSKSDAAPERNPITPPPRAVPRQLEIEA